MKPWDGKLRVATQSAGARYAGRSLRCKGRALRKTRQAQKVERPRLPPAFTSRRLSAKDANGRSFSHRFDCSIVFVPLLYIVPLYFATVFYCTKATQAFIPAQFFSYAGIFYYLLSYPCTVFQIVYMFGGLFTISLYPWLANRRIICYNMKLLIGSSFKSQVNTRAFAPWLEVRSGNKTFSVPKSAGALGVFFLFGPSFHSACFFRLS